MKKYLFGIIAIALAIGFSAFTKASPGASFNAVFEFDYYAISAPTQAEVEDEANWVFVPSSAFCNNGFMAPCAIEVGPAYYSGLTLLSTASLIADPGGAHPIIYGNTIQIINKN